MLLVFLRRTSGLIGATVSVTAAILALSLIPQPAEAGIGITPADLILEDMLPKSAVEQTFFVSRGNPEEASQVKVTVEGPAASAVTAPQTLDLPQGQKSVPLIITINTGALAEGMYEAKLAIQETSAPLAISEGMGSLILTGAAAKIRFAVTNEVRQAFSIRDVVLHDSEEGQPLGFIYVFVNEGNVDARPSRIEVIITEEGGRGKDYQETIVGESLRSVQAFSEEEVSVLTRAQLKTGVYRAHVSFYDTDRLVFERRDLNFRILPPGTLAQSGTLEALEVDKTEPSVGENIRIKGIFRNTGTVGVSASLTVDIFRNTHRIKTINTENAFVAAGALANLDILFRPEHSGNYTAKGYVTFGPHTSNAQSVNFVVRSTIPWKGMAALLVLLVAGIIGFVLFRRFRRRKLLRPASLGDLPRTSQIPPQLSTSPRASASHAPPRQTPPPPTVSDVRSKRNMGL